MPAGPRSHGGGSGRTGDGGLRRLHGRGRGLRRADLLVIGVRVTGYRIRQLIYVLGPDGLRDFFGVFGLRDVGRNVVVLDSPGLGVLGIGVLGVGVLGVGVVGVGVVGFHPVGIGELGLLDIEIPCLRKHLVCDDGKGVGVHRVGVFLFAAEFVREILTPPADSRRQAGIRRRLVFEPVGVAAREMLGGALGVALCPAA